MISETEKEEEGECIKVKKPSTNETKAVEEEVRELQDLARTYQEQSRLKKKISTPNTRPSATYVGSMAVGLVMSVLGVIVCLDLLSLHRFLGDLHRQGAPCGKCAKLCKKRRLPRKTKRVHFTQYPASFAHTSHTRTPVFIHSRFPRDFTPRSLSEDPRVESVYAQESRETNTPDTHAWGTPMENTHLSYSQAPGGSDGAKDQEEIVWIETAGRQQIRCNGSIPRQPADAEGCAQHERSRNLEEDLVVVERYPEQPEPSGDFPEGGEQHSDGVMDTSDSGFQEDSQRLEQHAMDDFIRPESVLNDTEDPDGDTIREASLHGSSKNCAEMPGSGIPTRELNSDLEQYTQTQSQESSSSTDPSTRSGEPNCETLRMSDVVVNVPDNCDVSNRCYDNMKDVNGHSAVYTEIENAITSF
ncbi:uncharacterized protein LOC143294001 [Babylonia areolata]|uniref:uncharacterized protein LOC143294001 n=1 Tax=Babylonia areolata TaxID=304850 RepID=UPI003FD1A26C